MNQELLVSALEQGALNRSRGFVHTVRRTHQRLSGRVVWSRKVKEDESWEVEFRQVVEIGRAHV